MKKSALIIGGTGLLGGAVATTLVNHNWKVKVFSLDADSFEYKNDRIEYIKGNCLDKEQLSNALTGVNWVFYFLSTTFPKNNQISLCDELNKSLFMLDQTVTTMLENKVYNLVFPSSGGTIYGNSNCSFAKENDATSPNNSYGMGKMLAENMLSFYSNHGLNSLIFRVGNVYGGNIFLERPQGVIDIFVQKILLGEELTIWGNAEKHVRDYIFVDDFAEMVRLTVEGTKDVRFCETYNVGSGHGCSLAEIINILIAEFDTKLKIKKIDYSGGDTVDRIVLDITKITKKIEYRPQFDICFGIRETIKRKRNTIKRYDK